MFDGSNLFELLCWREDEGQVVQSISYAVEDSSTIREHKTQILLPSNASCIFSAGPMCLYLIDLPG